jgi:quinol monooxygenase YgiN
MRNIENAISARKLVNKMIMVQSTFQLVAEKRAESILLMKNMVRLCRQEHGCMAYEYFEGISDPNQLVLLQEWENADCLQAHYQTEHMDDFMGKLGDLLESPVTTRSYVSQEEGSIKSQHSDEKPKHNQIIH